MHNPDTAGNSSLHLAAEYGHTSIVRFLVDNTPHEIDGPSKNNLGATPLHIAATNGHEEIVHLLTSRFPPSVDWRDKLGMTPLMLAARADRDSVVNVAPPAALALEPLDVF